MRHKHNRPDAAQRGLTQNQTETKETEKKALRIGMAVSLRSRLCITNQVCSHHLHDGDENDVLRRMRE